jgi:hypothetical protein
MHTIFWLENLKGRDKSEELRRRRENNIRMNLRKIGWEGVDRIHLDEDRDQWRALMKTVIMKLWIQ